MSNQTMVATGTQFQEFSGNTRFFISSSKFELIMVVLNLFPKFEAQVALSRCSFGAYGLLPKICCIVLTNKKPNQPNFSKHIQNDDYD